MWAASGKGDALVTARSSPARMAAAHIRSKTLSMLASTYIASWLIAQWSGPSSLAIETLEWLVAPSVLASRQGYAPVTPVARPPHLARAHVGPLAHPVVSAPALAHWPLAEAVNVRPPIAANDLAKMVASVTPLVEPQYIGLTSNVVPFQ